MDIDTLVGLILFRDVHETILNVLYGFKDAIFIQCDHLKHHHANSIYPSYKSSECALIVAEN